MAENTRLQSIKRWLWRGEECPLLSADVFSQLYEETYLTVYRYIYGLSGGPSQEAEDLTAETYARAWKARQHFAGDEQAALGWIIQIGRNLVIDLSRRRKIRKIDEDFPVDLLVDPGELPEMDVLTREQISNLWQMLGRLSDEAREILVLRYMLGWQVRQIANHLGRNENNVTVTIKRTLDRLQRDWPQPQEQENG